jgi:diguanylate cyclase (GGDEF)-like protein
MKQFFPRLSSWWFATMTPVCNPLITIDERETMRKRHLLSNILFILFLGASLLLFQGFFTGASRYEQSICLFACCTLLLTLWINRNGYLKCASVFFLLSIFFAIIMEIIGMSSQQPLFAFFIWPALLLLPVAAALFLPAWGSLFLAFIEIVFMVWFVLIEQQKQMTTYMISHSDQAQFLTFSCIIISCIGGFCAISAATNKKAVIKADRATELEQAHQALSAAYTNQETAHEKLEMIHKELEEAYVMIRKQALTDGLTGLPNHRAVMDQFSKELEEARRYQHPLSILFFDVDRFKYVNDTYGHAAGDIVLCQIGEQASSTLRGGDTLGRFGGEEFVVLLPEADANEAIIVAERIRATVEAEPVAAPEVAGGIAITVSIGLSTHLVDGDSEHALLSQADEAMYVAKRMGRNQVRTAEEARQMYASGTNTLLTR